MKYLCPDAKTGCNNYDTCCEKTDGTYGCCEGVGAVCCPDKMHCCPSGSTCDVSAGTCRGARDQSAPILLLVGETEEPDLKDVVCPDKTSACPDKNTCCMLASGEYGCCPLPNAVCCSDNTHCCPNGYTCSAGTCMKSNTSPMLFLVGEEKKENLKNVVCPGGTAYCPDNNTCCMLASGEYGCCPLPNAVCCSDNTHCCPNGYTCGAGTCMKSNTSPMLFLVGEEKKENLKNVVCPGGTAYCPDNNTCCMLASGEYGCCPLPNAVCCSDNTHCCPNGYTCGAGTCMKSNTSPMLFLVGEEKKENLKNVVCPGGTAYCPDNNTCCMLASGEYGCCPLPNAVCCSDNTHCCPNGYTCSAGTCMKSNTSPMLFLVGEEKKENLKNVVCPGGTAYCPDNNTCCMLASGEYGCCPLPNAVCCSDNTHCCPNGYTCGAGTCMKSNTSPMLFLVGEEKKENLKDVVCPGGTASCPDNNTCCLLASGNYGCCPLTNAVCCNDHTHCCPSGYSCNTGQGTCTESGSHPMMALL